MRKGPWCRLTEREMGRDQEYPCCMAALNKLSGMSLPQRVVGCTKV
jgi:hypothetical protein